MRGEEGWEGSGPQQDGVGPSQECALHPGASQRTGELLHKTRSSVHLKLQLSSRLLQINAAAAPRVTARGSRRKSHFREQRRTQTCQRRAVASQLRVITIIQAGAKISTILQSTRRLENVMLISHLLPVAAGGQQVAVGSPAVAPVLEEVGKRGSTKLKREGGTKGSKAAFVQPAQRQTTLRRGSRRDGTPVTTAPLASSAHNHHHLREKSYF